MDTTAGNEKMKILVLFIFSFCSNAYAQNITFKEIKLKPNAKFYDVNETTIIYPVVVTDNKLIDKLINNKIREEILEENEKANIRTALNERINDGLINMSYEVTFKKNSILSMNIYAEGCGAYCSSWYTYFNFDLKTGKEIPISDLISGNKLDSFQKIVFTDKQKFLNQYKEEEHESFIKNEIDSDTYHWAIEQVDSNCFKDVQIENFSLSNLSMAIIDPCEFPHVIRSQQPVYELKYSYKFLLPFLKPKFQEQFLK